MPAASVEIVACPPTLINDALAIALRDLLPEQRREFAQAYRSQLSSDPTLFAAVHDGGVVDAAWGQLQAGNTAILWPPESSSDNARQLVRAVNHTLDAQRVRMTQAMVLDGAAPLAAVLEASSYVHLVDLLYMTWDSATVDAPAADALEFAPFDESQLARLTQLTESTYVDSQDCPAMNGRRPMRDVIEGYRATGNFRPENWWFVRAEGQDVGVLLLADHGAADFWELVYMGLVPESRGRGWGHEIVRYAQRCVYVAGAERMLVAVDAANKPAIDVYREAGFVAWDRRSVFARFCDGES
jgi:GNAT superfamily N-acetyltransferase